MTKYFDSELDGAFSALSDATRRRILERLGEGGCSVGELWSETEMRLPSFMKHVRVLEEAGLVRTEKSGRVRRCSLRPERLKAVAEWGAFHRRSVDEQLESLGEHLAGNVLESDE